LKRGHFKTPGSPSSRVKKFCRLKVCGTGKGGGAGATGRIGVISPNRPRE